jgi:preprotein translocase subunit SecA
MNLLKKHCKNITQRLQRTAGRLNGKTVIYDLHRYQRMVDDIQERTNAYVNKTDATLHKQSLALRNQYALDQNLQTLIIDAFALANVAIKRVLKLQAFDEQLIAGLVLNEGKLAEMQTGEGKTLAAVFPAYLNALTGRGVQVLTFNDYLARRDALWAEPVYAFLGVSVAYVQQNMSVKQRRMAYAADITYLTAKEFGFDYLRDGLCYTQAEQVQHECYFTIVDEADSILIDEARVPLVLAAASHHQENDLVMAKQIVEKLNPSAHIVSDKHKRNINLSDKGCQYIEQLLRIDNLYADAHREYLITISYALHAHYLLTCGIDYLVKHNEILLVDEFTGRIADARRWPDGLHAAVEIKENLSPRHAGVIQNSVSLQHLLKLCRKLSGMSATCESSAEEFHDFYNLHTVVIPPHKHSIRIDHPDRLFVNQSGKKQAVVAAIDKIHQTGRPILVGTASVADSYEIHQALQAQGLEAAVLNADNDSEEAKIIAQAGRLNAITISTNMAGRGTDIVLGGSNPKEKHLVKSLGGLYVIGTSRYESPRIDRQLRGRAGRQGDPGASAFFISMDDPLYRRFDIRQLVSQNTLDSLAQPNTQELQLPLLAKKTDQIQRIIDGENYEIRKTLISYSQMIDQQRKIVRFYRTEVNLADNARQIFKLHAATHFAKLKQLIGEPALHQACITIILWCIDDHWQQHLGSASDLQEDVRLRTLGGNTPLFEFQKQVKRWFDSFFDEVEQSSLSVFNSLKVEDGQLNLTDAGISAPSSTWTYQINDALFENMRGQLFTQPGLSAIAGLHAGVLLLLALWKTRGTIKK